jgi:GntR family transcriptional regulator/MocR family aminotransferase
MLEPGSTMSMHKQLTMALKDAIQSGRLAPGQMLPSSRELAQSLGLSRDTIVRSYDDLSSQGFIQMKTARGTFVSLNPPVKVDLADGQMVNESPVLPALSAFANRLLDLSGCSPGCADSVELNHGAAPADILPVAIWRQLLSRRCAAADGHNFDCAEEEIFGYRPLRQQISRFLNHAKGLSSTPNNVIVFSDSQSHLDLVARMTINPGDLVVCENPGYTGARELFEAYGARVHTVPVDEHGMMVAALNQLEERCKLLYVTPSHHDPTGAVMPLARRLELLSWAESNCDFIVEDGFDSDYFYGSVPPPALQTLTSTVRVFYIYSFWKTLFPLVTTGCLVIPPELVDAFNRAKLYLQRNFSLLEHQALTDFLAEGHLERHIHKTRILYNKRKQALVVALKRVFQKKIFFLHDSAGLHFAVRFVLPVAAEDLLACATEAGLYMATTSNYYASNNFYASNSVDLEFLVNFASIDASQADDIVAKFAERISALSDAMR